jgi:hypothetical protein
MAIAAGVLIAMAIVTGVAVATRHSKCPVLLMYLLYNMKVCADYFGVLEVFSVYASWR